MSSDKSLNLSESQSFYLKQERSAQWSRAPFSTAAAVRREVFDAGKCLGAGVGQGFFTPLTLQAQRRKPL